MPSFDEDEDLKLAISLSLQKDRQPEIIDVDSNKDKTSLGHVDPVDCNRASSQALAMLGIDRKKMEQERLARKRKPSVSPPPPCKAQKLSTIGTLKLPQRDDLSIWSSTPPKSSNAESLLSRSAALGPPFLKPTVKKTWAFGHSRTGDDIKLEEVLQKPDLNLAVLSSFQWDMEWLLAKLNTTSVL